MRVFLFANNRLGWRVTEHLRAEGAEIVGLAVHPPGREKYAAEIIDASGVPKSAVVDGSQLREKTIRDIIASLKPELGISALFGYILREEMLALFRAGCVNLHPSFLPFNRGAYPNVWSIVENTPAGATLHYLDEGVDTGDLIAQRRVEIEAIDTGASLYEKLEAAALQLFKESWPLIAAGRAPRLPQASGGTSHRVKDVSAIDEIDLDRTYTARELINILRARTFPPYAGAFYRDGHRRVQIDVQLRYAEQPAPEASDVTQSTTEVFS